MTQKLKPLNSKDLDAKPLFTPPEALSKIKRLLEIARRPDEIGEIQKEEIVPAIKEVLLNTELSGQILPFGWENLDLEELARVVSIAGILFNRNPFYIV